MNEFLQIAMEKTFISQTEKKILYLKWHVSIYESLFYLFKKASKIVFLYIVFSYYKQIGESLLVNMVILHKWVPHNRAEMERGVLRGFLVVIEREGRDNKRARLLHKSLQKSLILKSPRHVCITISPRIYQAMSFRKSPKLMIWWIQTLPSDGRNYLLSVICWRKAEVPKACPKWALYMGVISLCHYSQSLGPIPWLAQNVLWLKPRELELQPNC